MAALRRINQDDLRNHNLSVVIDILLRTTEPLSRAELAKRTGLTKATMSLLVSMLVDDGVVREGEPSVQSSYGRPSTPLLIAGGRYCGIGLQVNTDGYGVIVLDLDGTVISERWVDADMSAPDADEVFAELNTLALEQEALLAERGCTVAGAGLALPGLVTGDMRLLMARNLGWEQLDLTRFDVMRRLDVTAGNEANMAALAQIPGYAMRRDGDGIVGPSESFIYLSTDVGIGGAVVRNGHVESGGTARTGVPVRAAGLPGDVRGTARNGGIGGHRQRLRRGAPRIGRRADRPVVRRRRQGGRRGEQGHRGDGVLHRLGD